MPGPHLNWVMPGPVFENVGVNYTGPQLLKLGHIRKPTMHGENYVFLLCNLRSIKGFVALQSPRSKPHPLRKNTERSAIPISF
jgi:hypothetical protein